VGLRSPDSGASIIEPLDPLIDQYWMLFARIRDELGGDSQVGRRLCGLLRQAGFIGIRGSASFASYGTADSLQWYADIHSRFALDSPYTKEWLERGWVERETLEKISIAWKVWAEHSDAFAARAWGETVGWKE
jgi:hypothetical protein